MNLTLDRSIPRDATGVQAAERLLKTINIARANADPDKPFWYLGGPMTGIEAFNFPAFHSAAASLRLEGYNIVSPAELDDTETAAAAMASPDGAPGSGAAAGQEYEDFLSRDLIICSLPTCIGGIFLEGWQTSRGARGESWLLAYLRKQIYQYTEGPRLMMIPDRDKFLRGVGIPDHAAGAVPRDEPGVLTVEAADDIADVRQAIAEHLKPPGDPRAHSGFRSQARLIEADMAYPEAIH